MGDQGVKVIKPGEVQPQAVTQNIHIVGEAEIDSGTDDIEDYDDNINRSIDYLIL